MSLPVRVTIVAHTHRRNKAALVRLDRNVVAALDSLRRASYAEPPLQSVETGPMPEAGAGHYWALTVVVPDRKRANLLFGKALTALERDAALDLTAEHISVSLTV